MAPSRKIFMGITGAALIALGIICILKPMATIVSLAWIIGIITLVSGISTLFSWICVRNYFTQSGSIFLSAILQIICGIIFLRHDLALATILPVIFALYLIFEGINLAVRSFDYKKVGFGAWWINLIMGILAAILGILSLGSPITGGITLTIFLGCGFIDAGIFYFVALFAINKFGKRINKNPWIDEY